MLRRLTGFFVAGTTAQLIGILVGIVQARTLGPSGKSVIAYAVIGLSMALTATDGLCTAVLTQVGREKRSLATVHAAVRRVAWMLGVPFGLLLASIAVAVPSQRPLLGAALVVPFAIYVQGSQGIFLAIGSSRAMIIQGALNTVVFGLVLIPVLIFAHASAYVALSIWALAWCASALYSFWACRRLTRARSAAGAAEPSRADVQNVSMEQLRWGAKNGAAMFAGYINMRIDVFLVSAVLGSTELGVYTLAVMTGELLWSVSQPVVWANLDRVAGASFEDATALVVRLTRNVLAVQFVLGLVFAAVGPPLIALVYGSRFSESGAVLECLLPGIACYAARTLMGNFILVRLNRPLFLAVSQGLSATACAVISLLMFPRFGTIGAAAATSVTYCSLVVVQALVFCRATGTRPIHLLVPTAGDVQWYKDRIRTAMGAIRRKQGSHLTESV